MREPSPRLTTRCWRTSFPVRRCNLACEYCNEYDDFSKPVPTETMFQRVDKLAALGTSVITISGGEPLLHPELDEIIARIRKSGMIAGMITNGYLLVAERIERLNRAGLEWLQISIDNVTPDEVSKKSLKVLDKKLELLARVCGLPREHQLGGRRRHPQSAGRAHHRQARVGTGFHLHHRNHSRWLRPAAAAERGRARDLPRDEVDGEEQLHPHQRLSGQHRATAGQTSGAAAPAHAISTFAKTAWCTTARSSAATRQFLWRSTRSKTFAANICRKKPALPIARFHAYTRCLFSTPGAPRNFPCQRRLRQPATAWFRLSSACLHDGLFSGRTPFRFLFTKHSIVVA